MFKKFSCAVGLVLIAPIFLHARAAQQQPRHGCLAYEPSVVSLKGKVSLETFPGPPNYESIRKGDRKETVWVITLAESVCVNADEDKSDFNVARKGIRRLELVFSDGAQLDNYKDLLSNLVVATGTLSGAHPGHHHSDVLLTVKSLTKSK